MSALDDLGLPEHLAEEELDRGDVQLLDGGADLLNLDEAEDFAADPVRVDSLGQHREHVVVDEAPGRGGRAGSGCRWRSAISASMGLR